MLESTQEIKKVDLNNYVINHQRFRVTFIILCNLQTGFCMITASVMKELRKFDKMGW